MGIFIYGKKETDYLKERDPALGAVIDKVGVLERGVEPDLFCAIVNSIVGQQISTKAQTTIWNRMKEGMGDITPEAIDSCSAEDIQKYGISFRKAGYCKNVAGKIVKGELDLDMLSGKSDEEIIAELVKLNGIGVWTAEMIMIFSMQRPDVMSFGDLAIHRGLRMLYHHREIARKLFDKYKRRYSPYASVASLYLWAIAGGEVEGMKDYAPKNKK